jgi:hypothetical protein
MNTHGRKGLSCLVVAALPCAGCANVVHFKAQQHVCRQAWTHMESQRAASAGPLNLLSLEECRKIKNLLRDDSP